MSRITSLTPEFVEHIPQQLDRGRLYVSVRFATAAHACCCGCGSEVVTPLSPTDWVLIFDGETVSLDPSIGNWSFECQSHYWIRRNRVEWARRWSREKIAAGRTEDRRSKEKYFGFGGAAARADVARSGERRVGTGLWSKLREWFE